jgi:hypothetical protein
MRKQLAVTTKEVTQCGKRKADFYRINGFDLLCTSRLQTGSDGFSAGYGAGKEKPGRLFFHPCCGCNDNYLKIIFGCTIKAVFFVLPTLKRISFALGRK